MAIIRTARASDAKALGQTHHAAWQETYRGMISDDYLDWLSPALSEKIFTHRAPANIFVAQEAEEIVGFAVVGHGGEADMPPRSGELCGLYVRKQYQGQGLGRELFLKAEERLRSLGYKRMFLWVLDRNLPAQRFYEHMDMRPDGGCKHAVLGTLVTENRMVKSL